MVATGESGARNSAITTPTTHRGVIGDSRWGTPRWVPHEHGVPRRIMPTPGTSGTSVGPSLCSFRAAWRGPTWRSGCIDAGSRRNSSLIRFGCWRGVRAAGEVAGAPRKAAWEGLDSPAAAPRCCCECEERWRWRSPPLWPRLWLRLRLRLCEPRRWPRWRRWRRWRPSYERSEYDAL